MYVVIAHQEHKYHCTDALKLLVFARQMHKDHRSVFVSVR